MIIRIVKMTFDPASVDSFLRIFHNAQHRIEAFHGCKGVDLCRDLTQPNVFMTLSLWETAGDLEMYRKSELFNVTWGETKALFSQRPEAWSLEKQR
ncbi:MAG: antibiotic biosynthesis monooxygenase family protein [Chitinophagales bacterium]